MKKIKAVVIAPYEGLKEAVMNIAPRYRDQLEISAVLGDLVSGVAQAKAAAAQGADVIISRGGTAELIERNVQIPTINIEISGYDYMRTIKLAGNIIGPKALVGFPNITRRGRQVNELLQTNVDFYTVYSQEEIPPLLKSLAEQGHALIIGDVATCRVAEELDINNLLLTSGEESLESAFENVINWTGAYAQRMERLELLEQIAADAPERVIVLDSEGAVRYSTAASGQLGITPQQILNFACNQSGERELLLTSDDRVLRAVIRTLEGEREGWCVAFLREVFRAEPGRLRGITVRNFKTDPANREFARQNSIHSQEVLRVARSFCGSNLPVLLTGDQGVGKVNLAMSIHRYSDGWMKPFVLVDCQAATPEVISDFLRNGLREMECGGTICLKEVDELDKKGQELLADALEQADLSVWRVTSTASAAIHRRAKEGAFDGRLYHYLSQLSLHVPNLQQSRQDLQNIINLFIIEANGRLGRQVTGVDAEALTLLENHRWQDNFSGLQQAIYQMVLIAEGPFITAENVRATLAAREQATEETALSLSGTLEEIELRVIHKVLEEEDGNLSRTAERLAVGRSTLWRKLRDKAAKPAQSEPATAGQHA